MPFNKNPFCIFDFETTGINPYKCQLTQIAALMIDSRTLKELPNGRFNIEVKPEFDDEKAIAAGYDPVSQKALDVTKKTKEGLMNAAEPKVAWEQFTSFIHRFNPKKGSYTAPVAVGFNINSFDLPILQRYSEMYGPTDKDNKQTLFHGIRKVDLMDLLFAWYENREDVTKNSLDYNRKFLGFPEVSLETAHDALYDVIDCANIFVRFMKFHRNHSEITEFENSFANCKMDIEY